MYYDDILAGAEPRDPLSGAAYGGEFPGIVRFPTNPRYRSWLHRLLVSLGLVAGVKKSPPDAVTVFPHLGMTFDTVRNTLRLSARREATIRANIDELLAVEGPVAHLWQDVA